MKPEPKDGQLQVLFGRSEHKTSIAFERTAAGEYRRVSARFRLSLQGQNEGFSFALLPVHRFGVEGAMWDPQPTRKTPPEALATPDWAEPNLWETLAVGFDVWNPKDEDWFNENGNFYGRPEREVSLHWDGREIRNRPCPVEIQAEEPVEFAIDVQFVTGGALVSVKVGEAYVYENEFLPHVLPYEGRAALGFHGKGEAFLDEVHVRYEEPAAPTPAPIAVHALRNGWSRPGAGTVTTEADLLPRGLEAERIILTVRYAGPMERDYWDRSAAFYVWDEAGNRIEIARIITPFMLWDTEYRYDVDVTMFAPLLRGRRKIGAWVSSNVGQGFLVDMTFTYYRRPEDVPPLPRTVAVRNLWSGSAHFDKEGDVESFFQARTVRVPRDARGALVRAVVTGHGVMEFTELSRTLTVNGEAYENLLWTEECYLSPERPQFGTWKFDRAGWCPGRPTEPWVVDVSDQVRPGRSLHVEYAPAEFSTDQWSEHWTEIQVIFQR